MPIYYGKSADGSDAREFPGMFVSPDYEYWSNKPFTKEQGKANRLYHYIYNYMSENGKTLNDLKVEIDRKISRLSKSARDYVLSHYDADGNFKYQE